MLTKTCWRVPTRPWQKVQIHHCQTPGSEVRRSRRTIGGYLLHLLPLRHLLYLFCNASMKLYLGNLLQRSTSYFSELSLCFHSNLLGTDFFKRRVWHFYYCHWQAWANSDGLRVHSTHLYTSKWRNESFQQLSRDSIRLSSWIRSWDKRQQSGGTVTSIVGRFSQCCIEDQVVIGLA